jgi:hypothetical protein
MLKVIPRQEDPEPDVVLEKIGELPGEVLLQERHQRDDLEARPFPVFDGEGVDRQGVELEPGARLDRLPHGRDPGPMALDPRRAPLLRPSAVAVHDDRDMARETGQIDLIEQLPLESARRGQDIEIDHGSILARRAAAGS